VTDVYMREGTTSRVMAADNPYGEFHDFYGVSRDYFGYALVFYGFYVPRLIALNVLRTRI
jgi:hypothetical protein